MYKIEIYTNNTYKEVIVLTNINCSANCVYQKDGKCCFENVSLQTVTPASNCAYYIQKEIVTKK